MRAGTISAPGAAAQAAPSAPAAASSPAVDGEVERKAALLLSVGEECVSEAELRSLVAKKPSFVLYDGFEPSGRMHIAQGVFKAMNVNKCTAAGGTFIFWVADWFALMNDKMGGDLDRIKLVGEYLIEVWTAAGMDMSRVQFKWAADEITKHAGRYWTLALDVARRFTVARVSKCCQIMGRKEGTLTAAQMLYPIMQCTDIFFLGANICQLGVDQRKVNMLAREYCDSAGIKLKPIILSHHMLYGLAQGQVKMSKSNKDSAIFMEDSAAEPDVQRKMKKAFCEPGNTAFCPPLAVARELVLGCGASLEVKRREEDGGDRAFGKADGGQLASEFAAGALHPGDLKPAVRDAAWGTLSRVRAAVAADKALAAAEKEVAKAAKKNKKK
ncbi:hypothetical protein EMIHUDRAFT_68570 [Emiliania huxleyi CCMP1516]|uniref:tyrosine--tRNA ligase n=2 Tax=Emiliania huxleyi TaxID=2903 RepID=A0A0D3I6U7_EMIH1|nr:hypothetical protein EMIHUDRAFT_68570 [Emiliania huxleyi CCMP1516]EOD06982.1 hypothetical protein EMIHUDRAFT_68570 [Emiliania huxleyi CCMP1516]|eukprot:XP_005759411.1 hypothetical protein EMIHUDRAFT_68570 [Emiliania huxleyi CCMP1516]